VHWITARREEVAKVENHKHGRGDRS
jgi:hypothetical protein